MRYSAIDCIKTDCVVAIRLPDAGGPCTIDEGAAADLRDCCRELALDDEVRVVTITGAGNVFAVGRMNPSAQLRNGPAAARLAWQTSLGAASAVASLPMPVIAIVNGDAIAHGLELALAADLRVAAATARLGAGNPASDGFPWDGATQRLPRLVGPALARDLLLTGRTLSAQEAQDAGLVNRVAPAGRLDETAAELVSQITTAAPIAARYAKEAVAASEDLTLAQGLRLEADLSVILQSAADRAEGLLSFAEKRAPQFEGR